MQFRAAPRPAWACTRAIALALAAAATLAAACAGDATMPPAPDGGADLALTADAAAPPADLSPAPARTVTLSLDAGAYPPTPAHPSALVYIPSGFDPTPPLNVIVYIHGWSNCVDNIVRDAGTECTAGGGTRNAYQLAAQLEDAHKNAILLCPEVAFDAQTSAPGTLSQQGAFAALLAETLADLEPALGQHFTLADVGTVVVGSHSGGYIAAAGIAQRGGVPVHEVWLFDSLYGNFTDYDNWVQADLPGLAATPRRRFADVYTQGAGTYANSQAMADRAAGWVASDPSVLVDDRTTSTWPDATYQHGLLFKFSMLTHDGVPRYYFGKMVASSSLPDKR
jgi:hypothetical protein